MTEKPDIIDQINALPDSDIAIIGAAAFKIKDVILGAIRNMKTPEDKEGYALASTAILGATIYGFCGPMVEDNPEKFTSEITALALYCNEYFLSGNTDAIFPLKREN